MVTVGMTPSVNLSKISNNPIIRGNTANIMIAY